jgi:ankyrin repeat protein
MRARHRFRRFAPLCSRAMNIDVCLTRLAALALALALSPATRASLDDAAVPLPGARTPPPAFEARPPLARDVPLPPATSVDDASRPLASLRRGGEAPFVRDVDRRMLGRARAGDVAGFRVALRDGANPRAVDAYGENAAVLAAASGDRQMMRAVIEQGVPLDVRGAEGFTPLCIAALKGHRGVAIELVRAGAALDARCANGMAPLHLAATTDQHEVVRVLVEAGADTTLFDRHGRPPLVAAAFSGSLRAAETLLDLGADPNIVGRDRFGALYWSVFRKNQRMVELLMSFGADPGAMSVDIFPEPLAFAPREPARKPKSAWSAAPSPFR